MKDRNQIWNAGENGLNLWKGYPSSGIEKWEKRLDQAFKRLKEWATGC